MTRRDVRGWAAGTRRAVALAGAALALAAAAGAAELRVETAPGGTGLVFRPAPGEPAVAVASVPAGARDVRLGEARGVVFASWDQLSAAGEPARHHGSVSLDGGRTWTRPQALTFDLLLRAGRLAPGGTRAHLPAELRARAGSTLHLVQFRTIGLAAWREGLAEAGAEVLQYVPEHAHLVRMDAAARARVERLPYVLRVVPYDPADRLPAELRERIAAGGDGPVARARYILLTLTAGPAEKALLAAAVRAAGGEVTLETPNGYGIEAWLDLAQVAALLHSDHLLWLQPWSAPEDDMDIVRDVSGANFVETVGGYDGTGLRGEVLDGGFDQPHQDFDGALLHGAVGSGSHGTCTYGIVFGNGARDGDGDANATGFLPRAQGYAADYRNLVDRYAHTAELVSAPIFASFQSNSWGSALTTAYDAISLEMDDIIWTNDLAIFQSQSNTGNQNSRPQAWAKNIVSVGAVNHNNDTDPANDCWCGGASIGPAEDGRFKPDIAHFYDSQYTTDLEPGGYAAGPYYDNFGGTSGATPITAGIGGLVTLMYADNRFQTNPTGATVFDRRPHAMTLKALLVNGATPYPYSADMDRVHQGWGLANARNLFDRAPLVRVINETAILRDGERASYTARVGAGQPELKVTMVYMDRAGAPSATQHRVNDVTLRVTAPDGTAYWGNVGLGAGNVSLPGGAPDTLNTVENVFLANPLAGDWTVEVFADEVNQDVHRETPTVDQDFALVVSGVTSLVDCGASVPVPTGVTASPAGDNQILVTWSGSSPQYQVYRAQGGCSGSFQLVGTVSAPTTSFTDTGVSGGVTYGYVVRAVDGCVSGDSACDTAVTTGDCLLLPSFPGVASVSTEGSAACGMVVTWPAAAAACGGPVVFNVYRSTTPGFTPAPSNRVASCLTGTSHTDRVGVTGGQTYYYVVRAEDVGGASQGPCAGTEEGNTVELSARSGQRIASFDFEAGLQGWTPAKGNPAAATGDFVAGDPEGTVEMGPAQPEDAHGGVSCLFTAPNPGGALGTDDIDAGEVMATSPRVDLSALAQAQATFWRWFYNRDLGEDAGDYLVLEASSDDGVSWTSLETLDTNVRANAWTAATFDLGTRIALTNRVRLRVRAADGTASTNLVEAAIDDVEVLSPQCTTAAATPGVVTGTPGALLLAKRPAGQMRLQWGTDCGGTLKYGVYDGDLQADFLAGYATLAFLPGMCDLTVGTADVAMPGGSRFYLVAPNDGTEEGSLGLFDIGNRRPQAAVPCYPRANPLASCAP